MYVGGHGIGINIHGCQPNLEMTIYVVCTKINFLPIAIENHCTQFNYKLTVAKTK